MIIPMVFYGPINLVPTIIRFCLSLHMNSEEDQDSK